MPMTTAQRATVRRRTSATTTEIDDTALDEIYDDATRGNSSLDYTTYYTLVDLIGVVAHLVDKSNEVDSLSLSSSQRYDHVEKLLARWETMLGLGTFISGAGEMLTWSQDS